VPYAAGGLPDTVARIFAQRLGDKLGQAVVVDNRPGANGVVAAQALATAPKDGYTFLVTDGSMFSINPAIYKNLGYDYKRDFMPVSLAARAPLYLAVNPKVPANTLQEFIALAKAKPGTLNYGSSGIGSTHHLTMEAMKAALGLQITHVPFKGTGQSVPALIGGQVEVLFSALPSLVGFCEGRPGQAAGHQLGPPFEPRNPMCRPSPKSSRVLTSRPSSACWPLPARLPAPSTASAPRWRRSPSCRTSSPH
jgi:tripartite-type tricarboxylate transporter receptor subunit TctC